MELKKIISKKILSVLTILTLFLAASAKLSPSIALYYPIPELGNCSTPNECKFYCEIPKNTPACWSYGKYVMNAAENVLGEETGPKITYPVAELDNCASANECFNFCAKIQNQQKCRDFAKKHGLVKKQTDPKLQAAIEAAKTELGCESKETCRDFCSQEANQEKCRAFAEKYGLGENKKEQDNLKTEVIAAATTELGCNSRAECAAFCNEPSNREKCRAFAEKYGLGQPLKPKMAKPTNATSSAATSLTPIKTPGNCASEEECRRYCEKYPNECLGFNFNKKSSAATGSGQFLGPAGCRTEAECKAYCQSHPNECPGFPKILPKTVTSPLTTITPLQNQVTLPPQSKLFPKASPEESMP